MKKFCQKLKYGDKNEPSIIFGLVIEKNDSGFLVFKTGKKTYKISQSVVISLEDTDIVFQDNNGGGSDEHY